MTLLNYTDVLKHGLMYEINGLLDGEPVNNFTLEKANSIIASFKSKLKWIGVWEEFIPKFKAIIEGDEISGFYIGVVEDA